ncbi:hypothetical protein CGC44_02405 [Francisella opportunistica]|uniref:PdpB n=1 Tax=Francisella opportunistica TaxID=2016517 RepID=A0A345JQC0_9GAMM|nr:MULTISPECIES: hypothetical protein [Francisella]APC91217.1 hypothetical protein BBG19_0481 [Francisella sp. MA067296]AXH29516.1 hypothetical protein CGC43_02430 [Francisella opportunistica]AXH31167.1 hypothetical protein CGC44_02405 [Francisella opportunistica]
MSFIKNHQIIVISILIITLILLVFGAFVIKKWRNSPRTPNKKSLSNIIKQAKTLIKSHKIKNKLSELYIFYGDYSAARDYITKLKPETKVIDNDDLPLIAIDSNNTSIIFANDNTLNLKKIKKRLHLHFYKLNFCFDISNPHFYEDSKIRETYKDLAKLRLKTLIVSFYSNSNAENIESFNNSIGKKSIFKLTKDEDANKKVDEIILSKILHSKNSISNKYFNIRTLNQIRKCLKVIYPEFSNIDKEIFFNFSINKPDNITAKTEAIFFSTSPKGIAINFISLLFSLIFIINIFQQIDLKQKISLKNLKELPNNSRHEILQEFKNKINDALLLESIYPNNIKYRYIYKQYASNLLKNVILPKYIESNDLSLITSFLIFFEYMNNGYATPEADNVLKIISSLTNLSESQLQIVLKYISPSVKAETMQQVLSRANKLYTNNLIVVGDDSESYLSTQGFNAEYLGISNTQRAKMINDIYIRYLYKCTIDNAISALKNNYIIPIEVSNIFLMYEDQFDTSSKKLCNSSYINSITKSVSLIFNQEETNKKFESFSEMLDHIAYLIKSLEKNAKGVSDENKEQSQSITISLINYVLNSVINSTYNNKELPLTTPVDKKLYMEFAPNFYSKKIFISPIYSKEYIKDNIDPINKKFNRLIENLKSNYNIEPDFMLAIYKSSINNYNSQYIKAYTQMIDELNSDPEFNKNITSKNPLNLYLLAMSSKDSSFNSLIDFYAANTNLVINEKVDNKTNNITKVQQFYKKIANNVGKQDNKQQYDVSLWSPIDSYFKENDDYLESKSYSDYKNIFKQLNNLIREEGYTNTYKDIKQGFKPLQKVYSDLSAINDPNNNNLYILLKKHLDIAVNAIRTITIQDAITNLDNTVNLEYELINNQFPFNKNSDKVVSNELITKDFDNNGYIYSNFVEYLKPLLTYNNANDKWESQDLTTPEQQDYLIKFNKVYALNKLLWDDKRNPKSIEFDLTPIANKDNDYIFFSIILDKENFVNSLNIEYSESMKILYNWNSIEPTTLTIKFDDGSTDQISYQGKWSILKAIKAADCNQDNICTWKIKHKGKVYPVSFKVESKILEILGWEKEGDTNVQ